MGKKNSIPKHPNIEIDALTWGAKRKSLSYGQYVSQIDEEEKERIIQEFKKHKKIG